MARASFFRWVWKFLAKNGACDEVDGAEYRRVFRLWVKKGQTMRVASFIRKHANQGPSR